MLDPVFRSKLNWARAVLRLFILDSSAACLTGHGELMTLEVYDPDKLDQLALRVLDVAANLRNMANQCRENDLAGPVLHDKKASEWLAKLEQWSQQATTHVHLRAVQARAQRRAMTIAPLESKPVATGRKSPRKTR